MATVKLNEEDVWSILNDVLNEDMGDFRMPTFGKPKAEPPPLPPHAKGSTPQALRKKSAPGEQLRQFKSNVNMMVDAAGKAQEGGVREALPWLDKVIKFATLAKESVK